MKKYGLHGKLKARKGEGETLASVLLKASGLVSSAKGCRLYIISRDNDDADTVWVTEVWDNKQDHDESLKVENVKQLIGEAMPLLDGMPTKGQEMEVIGGLGLKA